MPPKSQFGIQQFDTSKKNTLLGQPSNSRFSQLLSPGRASSTGPSGAGRISQSVLNSRRIQAQRKTQRAANLAAIPKRSGTFTLGRSLTGGSSGLGGLGGLASPAGQTVTTPRGPSAEVIQGLQGLVSDYNKSSGAANKANEERYQQLLGLSDQDIGQKGTKKTFERMYSFAGRRGGAEMGRTQGAFKQMLNLTRANTGQRLADIRSDYFNRGADQQQKLARLGMSNTTVGTTLESGNLRDMEASLDRASNELSGREIGILNQRQASLNQLSQADQQRRLGIMDRGQSTMNDLQQRI
ncbi:hypothetical protein LCGC14_1326290 [marine sediment metagenome]|uniref:Uncharacterized protein n=1 Tax=marine sediment metagenome TaxID=412755 RepID=A0A0F9KIM6_9ZZZZ